MQNRCCIRIGLVCFVVSIATGFSARGDYAFINVADTTTTAPISNIQVF
jgi:hypothetical protein